MEILAAAVVEALACLELSNDAESNADSAVAAMESIVAILADSSSEERAAIAAAVDAALVRERAGRKNADAISFYKEFMDSFGI